MKGERIGYAQMLDELRDTGYTGTELGDWGFMPTDPAALGAELSARGVSMVGAFVPVALKDQGAHAAGEKEAVKTARLLAAVAEKGPEARLPFIVLADNNGSDPVRTRNAGRVTEAMGLKDTEWKTFACGAERISRAVLSESGLQTVFHHHCAGYIETPEEIGTLMDRTDPGLLGLVFDTGHYAYGTGTTDAGAVLEALERFGSRIRHVHFKDCHPEVAANARTRGWNYFDAVGHGIFCELGKGNVDFPGVVSRLKKFSYGGWIVVEQDVLPGMGAPLLSARRNREYLRSIGL
jgi:inosose dehydratase